MGNPGLNLPPVRLLLQLLRDIWDFDPGDVSGTNRTLCFLSATAGLAVALIVSAVIYLQREDYFQSAAAYVRIGFGVSELVAMAIAALSLLVPIALIALFGGMIVWLSSAPERSYIGHLWRGAAMVIGGIVLYEIARAIMSAFELVG